MTPLSALIAASADPVIEIGDEQLHPAPDASLTGQLINQSGQIVNVAHVLGTFYDKSGQVVWVADQYVTRRSCRRTRCRLKSIFLRISRRTSALSAQSLRPTVPEGLCEIQIPFLLSGLAVAAMHTGLCPGCKHELAQRPLKPAARSQFRAPEAARQRYTSLARTGLEARCAVGRNHFFPAGIALQCRPLSGGSCGRVFYTERLIRCCSRKQTCNMSFLAKPSRLPVGLHDGITGAVYVFDTYHNLISPRHQSRLNFRPHPAPCRSAASSRQGAAWTAMDSTAQQGIDKICRSNWRRLQHARRRPGSRRSVRAEDERAAIGSAGSSWSRIRSATAAEMRFQMEPSSPSPRLTTAPSRQ
jgi:hypothetical protein